MSIGSSGMFERKVKEIVGTWFANVCKSLNTEELARKTNRKEQWKVVSKKWPRKMKVNVNYVISIHACWLLMRWLLPSIFQSAEWGLGYSKHQGCQIHLEEVCVTASSPGIYVSCVLATLPGRWESWGAQARSCTQTQWPRDVQLDCR